MSRENYDTNFIRAKIAFGNIPGLQIQIDELSLKCSILGRNSKNNKKQEVLFA